MSINKNVIANRSSDWLAMTFFLNFVTLITILLFYPIKREIIL